MISTDQVKMLREETGVSVMQCRKALEEAAGDSEKAKIILRGKSAESAEKKSGRALGAERITSYVHGGKVGAMVSLASETDFVANTEEFKALAHELAMHVAATNPPSVAQLLAEPFIKDASRTVEALIQGAIQKFGEKIEVVKFVRFAAGE